MDALAQRYMPDVGLSAQEPPEVPVARAFASKWRRLRRPWVTALEAMVASSTRWTLGSPWLHVELELVSDSSEGIGEWARGNQPVDARGSANQNMEGGND